MGQQVQRKLGNYDRLWSDDKKRYKHDGLSSSSLLSNGMQSSRSQPSEFKKPSGNMCSGSSSQRMSSNTLKPSYTRSNIYKPTCPVDTSKHIPQTVKSSSSSSTSYHMPSKYPIANIDNRNGINKNLSLNTNLSSYQSTTREMAPSYMVSL